MARPERIERSPLILEISILPLNYGRVELHEVSTSMRSTGYNERVRPTVELSNKIHGRLGTTIKPTLHSTSPRCSKRFNARNSHLMSA